MNTNYSCELVDNRHEVVADAQDATPLNHFILSVPLFLGFVSFRMFGGLEVQKIHLPTKHTKRHEISEVKIGRFTKKIFVTFVSFC